MKERDLLIILRTCQRVNMVHDNGGGRYIKVSKHELINVCMSSLVDSINRTVDCKIRLIVLDDHSDPESVKDFKTILSKCKVSTEFIPLDVTGNAESLAKVYELVEEHATDLWYHIEDDYLHFPEAIADMIATVNQFENNTGQMIAINPHDDIWRYTRNIYQSHILLGPYRHYRTVKHTTYSCLASRKIYDKYKEHFQDVVKLTREKADWVEDKTINLVWAKSDVLLFSPIPTLALHIMDETGMDPYINIGELWDSIPELWN
jgi:hypothetical protein